MNPEQTPRVVIFTTAYLPFIGGAEVAIDQLTKRIPAMRFLIITSRMSKNVPSREQKDNIEVRRVGFGYTFDKWLLPLLGFIEGRRALKLGGPSLLWGVMISQGTLAGYFLKKVYPSTRLVITLQEGDSEEYLNTARSGLIKYFWRKVLGTCDGVSAISKYLAQRAVQEGYSGQVSIIPNGADESYITDMPDEGSIRALRDKLGLIDDRIILSVSRLVEKNGLDILIRAMQKVKDVKLVIVGDGPLRRDLGILANELHVDDRVIFAGNVSHRGLLRYYQTSELFVRSSRSEGLGSVFIEAMAAGIPIMATRVGGIVDIVNSEVGVLIEPGDEEILAANLNALLNDKQRLANMGASGRMFVKKGYLWGDLALRYEQFFREHLS
ncbi:MAG: glycosyltransferase family 4 protein [bacterium]|nr:glycosyltransferase family 4 protein [bacterium]